MMFRNNPTKLKNFTMVLMKVLVHPKSSPHPKNIDSLKKKKRKEIKSNPFRKSGRRGKSLMWGRYEVWIEKPIGYLSGYIYIYIYIYIS
jgi:hypothetical protein